MFRADNATQVRRKPSNSSPKQRLLGGPTALPQIAAFGDFYDYRTTAGMLLRETLGRQHSTQTRVISDAAEHLPPYKSDLKRSSETNATASMLETAARAYRARGLVTAHRRVAPCNAQRQFAISAILSTVPFHLSWTIYDAKTTSIAAALIKAVSSFWCLGHWRQHPSDKA